MDEVAALRELLQEQWEYNHAEHCGGWPHKDGEYCHWPRPAILGNEPIPTTELTEKPPYLR